MVEQSYKATGSLTLIIFFEFTFKSLAFEDNRPDNVYDGTAANLLST